jgi:hypothetical protein
METDYPASHSMDTTWFCVDRDGHVAAFDSGEAGAAPENVRQDEGYELVRQLSRLLPAGEFAYDLAGRIRPGEPEPQKHYSAQFPEGSGRDQLYLMFLNSLDPVNKVEAGRVRQVRAHSGLAVVIRNPGKKLIKQLHESGACLGCFWHWERLDPEFPDAGQLGLYSYSHLCENWISGPYGREKVPLKPIHVDQLPPIIRNAVKQIRLNLRFAETPYIQPLEHIPCASWETAWLSFDCKTIRPIPGQEEVYAENYDELRELHPGLHVEPPAKPRRRGRRG